MAQGPESRLVTKIKKALAEAGAFFFKVHGGPYQSAGIADLIGLWNGRFVALEVKVPGRKHTLTELQAAFLESVRAHGGIAACVDSVEEALAALREQESGSGGM